MCNDLYVTIRIKMQYLESLQWQGGESGILRLNRCDASRATKKSRTLSALWKIQIIRKVWKPGTCFNTDYYCTLLKAFDPTISRRVPRQTVFWEISGTIDVSILDQCNTGLDFEWKRPDLWQPARVTPSRTRETVAYNNFALSRGGCEVKRGGV